MTSWFQLIRIKNLLLISLSQILISCALFSEITIPFVLYIACTFFYAGAGNIVNDIFDTIPDKINKPNKLIINTQISLKNAWLGFTIFNALGFLTTIYLYFTLQSTFVLCILIVIPLLLYYYSLYLKQTPLLGNLSIAILTSLSIFLILFFYPNSKASNTYIYVLSFFCFLLNLIREIVKDLEDLKGDKNAGLKTLPILMGTKSTVKIVRVLLSFAIISILTTLLSISSIYFKLYITTTLLIPLCFCFFNLKGKNKKNTFSKVSTLLKITIALGIFTVLFL